LQRHKNAGTQNAIAWGSYPGQAIAVRRAAQERRSQQTWPVTPDGTGSKKRFSGHPTKPATPPSKAVSSLDENKYIKQTNVLPRPKPMQKTVDKHNPFIACYSQ